MYRYDAEKRRLAVWIISAIAVILIMGEGIPLLTEGSANGELTIHAEGPTRHTAVDTLASIDGHFIENRGQVAASVRFYSRGNPSVAFRDDGVMFVVKQESETPTGRTPYKHSQHSSSTGALSHSAYLVRFAGAGRVIPVGEGELPFKSNFLLGNDVHEWKVDVSNYRKVVYEGLYAGIDLVFEVAANRLKYTFLVHPGADPSLIELNHEGVTSIQLAEGGVVIRTEMGDVFDSPPYSYQESGDDVECTFSLRGPLSYGFDCKEWDTSRALVIDPALYSTFLGGGLRDLGYGIALDTVGNAYVTGWTYSANFPVTPGAFDSTIDSQDAFVAKLNSSGSTLVYATFLGGNSSDLGTAVHVDTLGRAYVAGWTSSPDFPATAGSFDTTHNGQVDTFVVKLNENGNALVYATYVGGAANDFIGGDTYGEGIAVDDGGNVTIVGSTYSSDFPVTSGAIGASLNGLSDGFVAILDETGSRLSFSSFIGGSGFPEEATSVTVDIFGNVYVTGMTTSADFPVTMGSFDTIHNGGEDGFVMKLDASGILLYSTFLGGSDRDFGHGIAVDLSGNAYVTGGTYSSDFPTTPGVLGMSLDGWADIFVTKIDGGGDAIEYSRYIGGSGAEFGYSVGLDALREVYVTGWTDSIDFPITLDAFDTSPGADDGYVLKLERSGKSLVFSSYLGGNGTDWGLSLGVGPGGNVYIAGGTFSADFPVTPGAFDTSYGGGPGDAFVVGLVLSPDYVPIGASPSSPVTVGLSKPFQFNFVIENRGGPSTAASEVVLVDSSSPTVPFSTSVVPPMSGASVWGPSAAAWTTPSTPGNFTVTLLADYLDDVQESNETNNIHMWTVNVVAGPLTTLVVGQPNVTAGETYVTSGTILSFSVLDQSGTGIRNTTIRVDGGPWVNYTATGPFTLAGEGPHRLEWSSQDFAGNVEAVGNATLVVDDTAPATTLRVGDPMYPVGGAYVTSATPLALTASDGGLAPVGLRGTEYRIGGGWIPYGAPFTLSDEGPHFVEYRSFDLLGNAETALDMTIIVDDTAPYVSLAVGDPRFQGAELYVTSATPIAIDASDPGSDPVGLAAVEYRVEGGAWVPYATSFTLPSPDGRRRVEYAATDRLGNRDEGAADLVVDDTPPETEIAPRAGPYTPDTVFTLTPTDAGSGVARTEYRLDDGSWTRFVGGFSLPLGNHTIRYRSVDYLGNTEPERALSVTIEGVPPPAPEANWKPLVAAVFAAILAVAGWRASRSRWSAARIPRRQRIRVFASVALPFIGAEAATGIVSALTGLLSIPPLLGVGTAVDLGILAAGLAVSSYEVRRWTPPRARSLKRKIGDRRRTARPTSPKGRVERGIHAICSSSISPVPSPVVRSRNTAWVLTVPEVTEMSTNTSETGIRYSGFSQSGCA